MTNRVKNAKTPAEAELILSNMFENEEERQAFRNQNADWLKTMSEQFITKHIEKLTAAGASKVYAGKIAVIQVCQNVSNEEVLLTSKTDSNVESTGTKVCPGEFIATSLNQRTLKPVVLQDGSLNQWAIKATTNMTAIENLCSRYEVSGTIPANGAPFTVKGRGENNQMLFVQNGDAPVVVYLKWGSNEELVPVTIGAGDMINISNTKDTYPVGMDFFSTNYYVFSKIQ